MKRIFLSKSSCRTLEFQISSQDKKLSPKENRKWGKIADKFVEASDDFDIEYENVISNVRKLSAEFAKEKAEAKTPEEVSFIENKIASANADNQEKLLALEDTLGVAPVHVDLEEDQLAFLNKLWDEIEFPRERRIRRQVGLVTDALENAKELVVDKNNRLVLKDDILVSVG